MINNKIENFKKLFKKEDRVLVAYSGGVDSTLLLYLLAKVAKIDTIAVTIKTPYVPEWEAEEAVELSKSLGIDHDIISLKIPDNIKTNPTDRCYLCKKELFNAIIKHAKTKGCNIVADGTNYDDKGDHRPGMKALSELNIKSPLLEAGFTKRDIRTLLKEYNLKIWNKPAYACLLTRIPHNTNIDLKMLKVIEDSERFIHQIGFPGTRVRKHGEIVRIESPPHLLDKIFEIENRTRIVEYLKSLGIEYVTIDLEGYRTGSMNIID
jgi:uncharacterized protein (TIGR00268 family)